jgi:uncharacterized Ntn-hydrolase superfamily protein
MTFSICVHEAYETPDGEAHDRFGVAVTTRLPGVGTLCPFVSENGAIATQSLVNVDLGRDGLRYLEDGLAVDDALEALLAADDGAPQRQLHGVDAETTFAFSGTECGEWFGHAEGEQYTVAGNLLTGESVIEATAEAYDDAAVHEAVDETKGGPSEDDDGADPLAKRLIDALAAGHAEGGDKREELPIQSAAVVVETTESYAFSPPYNDLRIDATETPIDDLRDVYDLAVRGYEDTLIRYEDAFAEDSLEEATEVIEETLDTDLDAFLARPLFCFLAQRAEAGPASRRCGSTGTAVQSGPSPSSTAGRIPSESGGIRRPRSRSSTSTLKRDGSSTSVCAGRRRSNPTTGSGPDGCSRRISGPTASGGRPRSSTPTPTPPDSSSSGRRRSSHAISRIQRPGGKVPFAAVRRVTRRTRTARRRRGAASRRLCLRFRPSPSSRRERGRRRGPSRGTLRRSTRGRRARYCPSPR